MVAFTKSCPWPPLNLNWHWKNLQRLQFNLGRATLNFGVGGKVDETKLRTERSDK